jgi:hypothetical protein
VIVVDDILGFDIAVLDVFQDSFIGKDEFIFA